MTPSTRSGSPASPSGTDSGSTVTRSSTPALSRRATIIDRMVVFGSRAMISASVMSATIAEPNPLPAPTSTITPSGPMSPKVSLITSCSRSHAAGM